MTKKDKQNNQAKQKTSLRNQAEEPVRNMEPVSGSSQTNVESQRALHELHVHQIELEMQNEELRAAQTEIEAGRARYLDLYDLAPVGYCTLSEHGLILEANLTAAALLGSTRDALIKQPISSFIFKDDQDICYLHRQQLFHAGKPQECELRMIKPDGAIFWAHLKGTVAQAEDGTPLCRVVLSDITERRKAEESLRIKNMVFDASLSASSIADTNGILTDANEAFVKLWGCSNKAEVLGRSVPEFFQNQNEAAAILTALTAVNAWEGEFTARRKDGSTFIAYGLAATMRNKQGNLIGFHSAVTDITERKQIAEEAVALKESLDAVAGFVFAKDLDLKYVSANRSFCDLLKIPYNKIQGMTDYDIFPADLAAKYIADDKRVIETAEELTVEEETINANTNQRFIVQTRKFPRLDNNGRVTGIYGVGYDVTELKQAEYALRESEKQFRKILDCAPVGVFLDDKDGKATFINRKCAEIIGVPQQKLYKFDWKPFLHPDDRDRMVSEWEKAFTNKTPFRLTYRWVHPDGKVVWTLGEVVPVVEENGTLSCFIGTITDITAQKQAEAERENLQSQLAQAQKMESVGRLAGGVAHDFNNMLGVILGQTELAIESLEPDAPLHGDLKEIQKAARRSADLTRQLLAFARKQTVTPKVLDLNETVSGTLKMIERLIGEDIDISWKPGHGLWPVKIDPAQLDQIIANLCVNARDAITGAGKIIIETVNTTFDGDYCAHNANFIPGDFVLLSVSDNGCGMDAEMLERVFEPFFTTKDTGKGTGLGLATVYGAVKQNQGFIQVDSEPGRGTTFDIYLPRYTGQAEETKEPKPQAAERGSGETILLVEDRMEVLQTTTSMLKRLGYQVFAAGTPREAIRLAQENAGHLDLLMTDVVMPEIHGRDLAKNLQSLYPGLRVLFMSGYTADVIAHHGVLHEGLQFIQKPFSIMELGAKLREVFAGRHAGQDKKQL